MAKVKPKKPKNPNWGGKRKGSGAKKKNMKAAAAPPAAEPKKRIVLDGSAMQVIADTLEKSARRSSERKPELNPFQLPHFPAKATPPKRLQMAMDSQLTAPINWAASEWATGFPGAMAAEGLTFLGFPYLSELAQVPEYRTFSEIIATEMTRKWIEFKGTGGEGKKSNAAEEGKTLRSEAIANKIKALKDELDRLEVRDRYAQLSREDGFFGRSHLFYDFKGANLDDTRGELRTDVGDGLNEVSRSKISKGDLQRLQVVEPVWTYPTTYNTTNPLKEDWYNPQVWYCMGKEVHRSRLPAFIGRPVPDLLKPSYAFGGLSLSQLAKPYVDIWRVTRESVGELIHSFSVMVLLTDLSTMLQPGGAGDLLARVALFNALRDNQGAFVVNKDSEDFKNVSASLSGLHELQSQAQEHMMSIGRVPAVKYTGMQPTGLNASSEGEIRSFYDTINAHQGFLFRPELTRTIRFAQLSLWGQVDPDITWDFVPLWELSDKEKADKRKTDADAGKVYIEGGVISPEEERARIASDPESGYHGLNPEDVPEPPMEEDDLGGGDPDNAPPEPGGGAAPKDK